MENLHCKRIEIILIGDDPSVTNINPGYSEPSCENGEEDNSNVSVDYEAELKSLKRYARYIKIASILDLIFSIYYMFLFNFIASINLLCLFGYAAGRSFKKQLCSGFAFYLFVACQIRLLLIFIKPTLLVILGAVVLDTFDIINIVVTIIFYLKLKKTAEIVNEHLKTPKCCGV